ncbi:MAG: FtsW/RodA/SpoVE family cell cycle protein [Anaerolineales bacterium]|nr:FtsW/RodA/SpoVE family cell cycle protein [Anaerolineales bacterium]
MGWLNPWGDPTGNSYQIIQSLLAVANGGILGRGLGIGSPLLVPVSISDFIFAAISEEAGLAGTFGTGLPHLADSQPRLDHRPARAGPVPTLPGSWHHRLPWNPKPAHHRRQPAPPPANRRHPALRLLWRLLVTNILPGALFTSHPQPCRRR